ncbi:GNAT family N-acetyltransferase [Planotetraspora sp. A-T 1434]|uniref:bifunctional acetate--CoA ligase family protein/GNAT family N-acetyltransferase n=1 Tax=Planotetraspora sp. A-T 1434 TaxID=2979219 RepID=UPI0021BF0368|nr:GNAT family N-acetyltransferase [Planotetraspora sp. A-T 1434]MCT9933385.1 GNAT family N-acetyltransferase [Planotetraspora sp. A-T 1434]
MTAPVYALLADGATVEIRQARPGDAPAIRAMHARMSPGNLYLRFFSDDRDLAADVADVLCRTDPGHGALLALLRDEVVGIASYDVMGDGVAEISFAVPDHMQGRGIGTLLMEHLGSLAVSRGVHTFTADTLAWNHAVSRVLSDTALPLRTRSGGEVVEITMPLAMDDRYFEIIAERERRAIVASLSSLFRPRSVAVVGASESPGSIGDAVLGNASGFGGRLYGVGPGLAGLPEPPDLAVITVAAPEVRQAAENCGRCGAQSLVVTARLDQEAGADLLRICRRYGMRLVGPGSLGIATEGLNATFAATPLLPGVAGVAVQWGGVGIALLEHLARTGIGVSSFAALGDKCDVSGSDMLMWWRSDERTRLAILQLESYGDPRRFVRTARAAARAMPVLTMLAVPSPAPSPAASPAAPEVSQTALFHQAGIVATDTMGELVEAAAFLATRPVPRGRRVAVLSSARGAGALAARACAEGGLEIPPLSEGLRRELKHLLPVDADCGNPVDTTPAVGPATMRECVARVARSGEADAVIAIAVPTALGDPTEGLFGLPASLPLAVVLLGQAGNVTVRRGVPIFGYPESAAGAIAHASRYGAWLARPPGVVPEFAADREAATDIVSHFLERHPAGGRLDPAEAFHLMEAYDVPVTPWRWATTADEAARAARELGGHVAVKAHIAAEAHVAAQAHVGNGDVESMPGAVERGLWGEEEVRAACGRLAVRFGGRTRGMLVQAMAEPGVETRASVAEQPVFGPLVLFGLAGMAADVLGDRAARLTPVTDVDADEMIRSLRGSRLLLGGQGRPAVDTVALAGLLMRLSLLAEDLPEVAELDLDPVVARPDGVEALDVRIRLAPAQRQHPYVRRLR